MAHEVSNDGVSGRSVRARARGRHSRARAVLLAGVMSAGVLTAVGGLGVGTSSAAGRAVTARTISLNENGNLRRTSHAGFKLNEQGSASGTIRGTIYIHLDVVSPTRVTVEVNIYPHGGSLSGSGSGSYHVNGSTASFSGAMSINRGSGSYAHAHGSGLSFSGTIQRLSGSVTVHLSGSLST
jgi:hypothetical protein